MKSAALKALRSKLTTGASISGLWVTLESPSITEIAVAMGLDWVVIDAEHGHLDWSTILEHIRATVRSDTVALVRVAELNSGLIKRALDIGADGIVVPWIESAEELKQAITFSKYPPEGKRGIGAERATCWGQCFTEHTEEANANILIVPLVETVDAINNIDILLKVKDIDTFFFGPADLSASAGYPGQWEGPGVADLILDATKKIHAAEKYTGVVATSPENFKQREREGFRMLGLGLDAGLLIRELQRTLDIVGKATSPLHADLCPQLERDWLKQSKALPLAIPPESFRPDRDEVMNEAGAGVLFEIEPGVVFEALVGQHNQAINLTTGIVTFNAHSKVPYHIHTFSESITILHGSLLVEVQGRRYQLNRMDNITIPAGARHMAIANRGRCIAHGTMATHAPDRELCEPPTSRKAMPDNAIGLIGPEYITRYISAKRYEAGPNTEFIDFFNDKLIPGIEMSGGYGLFHHGGRLPAHIHDFDESITIIEGESICNVEGRRYTMKDNATALQPRGRIHYFINETQQPMAMLWVYAGPMPERIEMDEALTYPGSKPWSKF